MGASCNIIQTLPNRNRVFRQRKWTFHDVRFGAQNILMDNDSKEMQVQYNGNYNNKLNRSKNCILLKLKISKINRKFLFPSGYLFMQSCKWYEKMKFPETNQLLNCLSCNCFQLQCYYMGIINALGFRRTRNTSTAAIYKKYFSTALGDAFTTIQRVLDVTVLKNNSFIQMTRLSKLRTCLSVQDVVHSVNLKSISFLSKSFSIYIHYYAAHRSTINIILSWTKKVPRKKIHQGNFPW